MDGKAVILEACMLTASASDEGSMWSLDQQYLEYLGKLLKLRRRRNACEGGQPLRDADHAAVANVDDHTIIHIK